MVAANSRTMDLPAIGAFVAVGERGGFRAAAAALGITSAGVSKAVARLEAQLGVTLVARTTRSVRLTPAGAAFHDRCKAILADLDAAGRAATEAAELPQGRLVISASRAFGRLRVAPAVTDFARQHPQVEVEMRFSDRPADLVTEGVDLAIRIGHLPDSGLVATRVAWTGFVLCASPDYLAANGTPDHPDDLRRHAMIGYVTPDTATRFAYTFMVDGAAQTTTLPVRLTMDDGEAMVVAAIRSAGLIMVNDYLVDQPLADGSLVRLLTRYQMPPVPISIVNLPSRAPSPAGRLLAGLLRRHLAAARRP